MTMGKASNRAAIERLIERSRCQEAQNKVLGESVAAQVQLINAERSDARVEALRRRKLAEANFRELATELAFGYEEQQTQQNVRGDELQNRITAKLGQQGERHVASDLKRQLICSESEEIRRLKEQLAAAKVNRERAAQLLERQYRE